MKRRTLLIIATAIALSGAGFIVWKLWLGPKPVACTEEAKICSDGSAVGRTGPNCEFAPCPEETGTVTGRVSVGPLCPVEPCDAQSVDFSSRQVTLESQSGQKITIKLYADGTFYPTQVAPGTYEVALTDCIWLGCESELPKTVVILSNQTAEVQIDIDTGIR